MSTGPVEPLRPPTFIDDLESDLSVDTIEVRAGSGDLVRWRTEPDATVFWVLVEKVVGPDSLEFVVSSPDGPTGQAQDGDWIGEGVLSFFFPASTAGP